MGKKSGGGGGADTLAATVDVANCKIIDYGPQRLDINLY